MVKAIDLIGNNNQLQNHWARRLVAIIIDAVVIWVIALILGFIIVIITGVSLGVLVGISIWSGFFMGIIWLLYSAVMEGMGGATIGKRMINLIVVSTEYKMDFAKALIRNVTKIHGLFLLIDFLVGFVTDGDPRQRFLDRVANTTVIRTDIQEIFTGAYQPPTGPMPQPYSPHPQAPSYQSQQPYTPPSQPTYQSSYAAGRQEGYEPPPPENDVSEAIGASEEKVEPVESEVKEEFTREELVSLKKDELIKIAKSRGLKVSGTKRDLINRILGEEEEPEPIAT